MVDTGNIVGEVSGKLFSNVMNGALYFILGVIIFGVIAFCMWFFLIYKRKFNIIVKVISERANDKDRIFFDKAAILTDRKTKTKYFRIWGMRIDLPAPKFNILQSTGRGDYLELYRVSDDAIYFLTPSEINDKVVIKSDGKEYLIADQKSKQVDEGLAFWNIKRKDRNKGMFSTESLLMKLLPYIPALLMSVIMIFVLYILLDHLPGILGSLKELTDSMRALKGADVIVSA